MPGEEHEELTPDEDAEKVEELEDLEASEDDAAYAKGGGPRSETTKGKILRTCADLPDSSIEA